MHRIIATCLVALAPGCAAAQEPVAADPMAPFARLVGGEWQVTFTSGARGLHAWEWGPGRHSMGRMASKSDTIDNPWAGEVMYWHPGRKRVCVLSLHGDIPGIGRGVSEGTIRFEGETQVDVVDLYQPGAHRKLAQRRTFDGPDKYHEILLEATGSQGYQPLAEWDFVRVEGPPAARPHAAEEEAAPEPSEHLKMFEALLGCSWEAKAGDNLRIQSTYEWIPSLEVVCARVDAPSRDGDPTHLLDAYFYQHIGTGALRCLALTNRGGVYEGEVSVIEGGALQFDLKGYEDDQVVPRVVRLDFEEDGTVRERVWSIEGSERKLILDVHQNRIPTPRR